MLGVESLWVADASVFPAVPRANTNLPTIEAAERLSDLIRSTTSRRASVSGGRVRVIAAAEPLELRSVRLRNRLVATAHASGLVQDGLPVAGDAEYWGRLAAGGAAMLIGGGTVTAPESAPRRGNILEAWRPEAVEPLRRRVDAIHAEGGVAVCQLVHLGRETLGADSYYSPIAPSAIRSPREPTAPRAMLEREVAAMVDGFRVSAAQLARGRASTASSCTPRTPICSSSSCRRAPTAAATGWRSSSV